MVSHSIMQQGCPVDGRLVVVAVQPAGAEHAGHCRYAL